MKSFWSFLSISVKNQSVYYGAMYVYFVSALFHTGVALLIWLFAQNTQYAGYSKPELLGYYVLVLFLSTFNGWYVFGAIAQQISEGDILPYMLRPTSYLKAWFAIEAGFKLISTIIFLVGTIAITAIFLYFKAPISFPQLSLTDLLIFLPSIVCGILTTFLFTYMLGLLAFWFTEVQFVDYIYFTIVPFLSGDIVPLTFFPSFIQKMNVFLPFRYQMSFSLEILFHKIQGPDIAFGYLISFLWISVLFLLTKVAWKNGTKAYMAFGQ
jgi:ABC-2 type transport system permease protein